MLDLTDIIVLSCEGYFIHLTRSKHQLEIHLRWEKGGAERILQDWVVQGPEVPLSRGPWTRILLSGSTVGVRGLPGWERNVPITCCPDIILGPVLSSICTLASFKGVLILYNQSLYFAELSSRFSSVLLWPLASFSILVITAASLSLKCWRNCLSKYIPSDLCHPHSYWISLSNHDAIVQRFPNPVLESTGMLVKHRGSGSLKKESGFCIFKFPRWFWSPKCENPWHIASQAI